ncbi:MAG: mechanosensitive ion channel family protein [Desulfobacterales bacterium]|nr:mechanosensitive ion channel family protein [Desulfobacterales bacterium]
MAYNSFKSIILFSLIVLTVLLSGQTLQAANAGVPGLAKSGNKAPEETVQVPENLGGDQVDSFMATLSDAQVRRLLIQELKEEAARELTTGQAEAGGLTGLVKKIHAISDIIHWRIYELKSGAGTDPEDLPRIYKLLRKGERQEKPDAFKTILSVIGVFLASFVIVWFSRRFTAATYRRIENATSVNMKARVGGLALRALLDILFLFIFAIVTLALFFIFLDRSGPQRVLVATYLAAFLIVMAVQLISRFFLTPKVPALRFLPMDDGTAVYLYRWLIAIAAVITFGWFTCGIFRVAGGSEANHLIMISTVALMAILMIIIMILQKREQVRQSLAEGLPETGFRAYLARIWYIPAIIAALFLWLFTAFNQFLGGIRPGAPGIKTLLLIPLYILLDWALREILRVAFGMAAKPGEVRQTLTSGDSEISDSAAEGKAEDRTEAETVEETGEQDKEAVSASTAAKELPIGKHLDIRRLNRIIGGGLRIALAAFVFFYLLEIWGVDIQFGIAVTKAASKILIVVLICYVFWEVISAMIQRRMAVEMPETDEDMEEGGAGGSRIGTLLLLLRKFMFAVIVVMATLIMLSAIGVNIGPLIAGAGVIGLAIGFGAQTLVKDIIAGVFFLMDDAFRVGDYIETAGTKGMVEHISLRSLRLRHPRGMVNTIPFGDMGIVTNMSRDYIITKLDFRVRYDTDVDKIRKIIKNKVYEPIMQNEELGPKLLDKIKSQGVRSMDDSAMIMRIKYKTAPGQQFMIRKEVYRLMQEAFQEAGIEFAHRNVTVYMPPETEKESSEEQDEGAMTTDTSDKKMIENAGAAAAIAVTQAEKDTKKQ